MRQDTIIPYSLRQPKAKSIIQPGMTHTGHDLQLKRQLGSRRRGSSVHVIFIPTGDLAILFTGLACPW